MQVNFGKVVNGALVRAKTYVLMGGVRIFNPRPEHYLSADDGPWYPIVDNPPSTDSGHYVSPEGWIEDNGKVVRLYKIRANPQETKVRKWTPLSIKRALEIAGKWAEIKPLMETAGLYDEFVMAQFITDADDSFKAVYAQACKTYGQEAVDAILAQIPQEA